MKLFDLHCDTATLCEQYRRSLSSNEGHVDLFRGLSCYSQWAQVMAIFVNDGMTVDCARQRVCDVLDYLKQQEHSKAPMRLVYTVEDLSKALYGGQCAVLPALENGLAIGSDLSRIVSLAKHGIVYITITWNGENQLGHGCMTASQNGLKSFGKEAVRHMYRCGIVPDVSHLNERGFWDVASIADGRPFMAGHTASKSVNHHVRNLTDEQFLCVKEANGLVGIDFCAEHLGEHSFERIRRHLDHWLSLGGEDVLALGMDLDGTDIPSQWHGIKAAKILYKYLISKGYSQIVLNKIFFENSYAFFVKSLTIKQDCITIGS